MDKRKRKAKKHVKHVRKHMAKKKELMLYNIGKPWALFLVLLIIISLVTILYVDDATKVTKATCEVTGGCWNDNFNVCGCYNRYSCPEGYECKLQEGIKVCAN